jgi:hypothetical protein
MDDLKVKAALIVAHPDDEKSPVTRYNQVGYKATSQTPPIIKQKPVT